MSTPVTICTPRLPELGVYLSLQAEADFLQRSLHDRAKTLVDFEYAETDAEVDEYCKALDVAEREFPTLCQVLHDLREAEENLVQKFLSIMEKEADRRQCVHIRNLRNGLHFVTIRRKVLLLAQKWAG